MVKLAIEQLGQFRPRMINYPNLLCENLFLPLIDCEQLKINEIPWQSGQDIEGQYMIAAQLVSALYSKEIEENYMLLDEES